MSTENPIVEKDLGPETKLKVQFDQGKLMISVDHQGKIGGAGLYLKGDAVAIVDAITDAIPGEMDDAIIDGLAEKLLSKKTGA